MQNNNDSGNKPQQKKTYSNKKNFKKRSNKLKSGEWMNELKRVIQSSNSTYRNMQQPWQKINLNTDTKIKITPLGGLGAIGGNITIIENEHSAILIDAGLSFPSDDMHGVDILIPDFTYVHKLGSKLKAIIITHAHEDHIGALAYLFKELKTKIPVYATPLPMGMISHKFEEHGLSADFKYFKPVSKRKVYKIADFKIEWIHVTHSIIDASALAIDTGAGIIFHTGDFKLDATPIDNIPTDFARISYYGEKGILCLLSDSTNSYKPGMTRSEKSVGPTFDGIFSKAKGRVIMSTFSSNIHRIYQAIDHGVKYGRKVCVIGRSMEKNLDTTMELGYIKLDKKIFIDPDEVDNFPDSEVLIITTGSQGENMSALYRMAINEHRHIKIKDTDQVIISAKAIPGNEGSVSEVLNHLLKAGASVAYQDFSEIHTSGHAAQEEQKLMLNMTKPKFFLPVHGEYNHILRHSKTGIDCGVNPKNIVLMSDGDQVEIHPKYMKKVGTVKTGKTFIDNYANKKIDNNIVFERQKLAADGIITIIVQIDNLAHKLLGKPKVIVHGLVSEKSEGMFTKDIGDLITMLLANERNRSKNNQAIQKEIENSVRKHVVKHFKKYPTITVVVV